MRRRRDLLRRLDRVWELLIVWPNVRSSGMVPSRRWAPWSLPDRSEGVRLLQMGRQRPIVGRKINTINSFTGSPSFRGVRTSDRKRGATGIVISLFKSSLRWASGPTALLADSACGALAGNCVGHRARRRRAWLACDAMPRPKLDLEIWGGAAALPKA